MMKALSLLSIFVLCGSFLFVAGQDARCSGVPAGEIYLFPYPGNCGRYYECDGGVSTAKTCDDGLWFNEAIQSCDHPDTSGCNPLVCPPTGVDYYPYPGNCNRYVECYHGTAETHDCPAGLYFNYGEKRCVTPEASGCGEYSSSVEPTWTTPTASCYGVLPGFIILKPYPGDCSRFIECIGADETIMSCPWPLYFDYDRQMCDQRELSPCDDTTGTPGTTPVNPSTPGGFEDPRCANGNSDYWPDVECSRFIECYLGHGYTMDCPSGLYFDETDKKCVDPSLSDCGRPTVDPDTTTRGGSWTPDPDCPWPTPDRYLFPFPGDCTKFLECVYGEKVVMDCPANLWFNPNLLVCDYPYHSGCIYALKSED